MFVCWASSTSRTMNDLGGVCLVVVACRSPGSDTSELLLNLRKLIFLINIFISLLRELLLLFFK